MRKQRREDLGVQPGDKVIIKGKVTFARVDKAVTGDALRQENERRARMGMNPIDSESYRSITIEHPEIVQGQGTPLAKFHEQTVYQDKKTLNPTMSFESKSNFAPSYGQFQADGSVLEMDDPMKNPAPGQEVYLLINAYGKKGFANIGSSFETIVYPMGEISFYEGGKGRGISGFGELMNVPVQAAQPELVGAGVGAGATAQTNQAGFSQAPVAQGQQNGFVGFGAAQEQTQQNAFGGAGQAPAQNQQNGNPFGIPEGSVQNQGNPFSSNGQPGNNPFA